MFLSNIKVLFQHKRQVIPKLEEVVLPTIFRGRPTLSSINLDSVKLEKCVEMCPTTAINAKPFSLDMGKCLFCGECERMIPNNIEFTNSWRLWSLTREGLVVRADEEAQQGDIELPFEPNTQGSKGNKILFKKALKLRQVCAGGDSAPEMELGAACNVNFDMGRYGIEFVASPRHCDGVVLTGPITKKMATPLELTYAAVADPKLLICVGVDAISGGLFVNSEQIDRSFLIRHTPNLYIAGHPSHPLAIIGGLRELMTSARVQIARPRSVEQ